MNEDEQPDGAVTPFDDYSTKARGMRSVHLAPIRTGLRGASAIALGLAFLTAAGLLALDAAHLARPDFVWRFKSAIPLICIGASYAALQFTLPRTGVELCLGLAVSLAFVLWGVEQFIPVPGIASLVDDVVVFLFVLDLSIVIRGKLRGR